MNVGKSSKSGLLLMGLLFLAMTGCATNRGVLNFVVPPTTNPKDGTPVKIVKVTDLRKFELAPKQPSIPSLKNGEITEKAITSRAIARKRNTYGMALGDILLPEGRTVQDLTREAVQNALREKGYVVVEKGASEYSNAKPMEIEIEQFWSWMRPGFWAISLEFESIVVIKSPELLKKQEEKVRGYAIHKTMVGSGEEWKIAIQQGLQNLILQIKSILPFAEKKTSMKK